MHDGGAPCGGVAGRAVALGRPRGEQLVHHDIGTGEQAGAETSSTTSTSAGPGSAWRVACSMTSRHTACCATRQARISSDGGRARARERRDDRAHVLRRVAVEASRRVGEHVEELSDHRDRAALHQGLHARVGRRRDGRQLCGHLLARGHPARRASRPPARRAARAPGHPHARRPAARPGAAPGARAGPSHVAGTSGGPWAGAATGARGIVAIAAAMARRACMTHALEASVRPFAAPTYDADAPSDGQSAVVTGPVALALGLERRDRVALLEGERDVVEALEQAAAALGVELERHGAAAEAHLERLEVDLGLAGRHQRADLLLGQHDRQQADLGAVGEEDVGEARRDDGPEAVVLQRPRRVLAARAAAEVRAGGEDRVRRAGPSRAPSPSRRTGTRRSRCARRA